MHRKNLNEMFLLLMPNCQILYLVINAELIHIGELTRIKHFKSNIQHIELHFLEF